MSIDGIGEAGSEKKDEGKMMNEEVRRSSPETFNLDPETLLPSLP